MPVPEKEVTVTFIKNPERLDDKLYCLCKQKWDGKLMIECELCDNWYHPQCIGINEHDDVKLNLMFIICSLCQLNMTRELPGSGEDALGAPARHKEKCAVGGPMRPRPGVKMNTTSVDMILSGTNLKLPDESKKEESKAENAKSVVNIVSQSKEGNIFRISLNQSKVKKMFEPKNEALPPEGCLDRDLKIIEPFSDIRPNRASVRSTEDMVRTQTQRVNKIFSRYYPTEADKSGLKKLKKLMVGKNERLLEKRDLEASCLRGSHCKKKSKTALKVCKRVKQV